MSLLSRLMARYYDATMRGMEGACLARWRKGMLRNLRGEVLEIGAGTGVNLPYYGAGVSRLVLTEPDPYMRRQLQVKAERWSRLNLSVMDFRAEKIDQPDASFDVIVCTLVLCTVQSQASSLAEAYRLLRPGGQLVFLEHVAALDSPGLHRWQRVFQPFWVRVCGNCHLTRDTEQAILDAGFDFLQIERVRSRGGPRIVSPTIKGIATKPR